MTVKNIWRIVKNRYRLSTNIQMNFELSFPLYLIGKCCISTGNANETRTKKVAISTKGFVFSDTIPLSWFTSSVLLPWEKIIKISISDTSCQTDCNSEKQTDILEYAMLNINDPQEITIELPWSEEFTRHLQKNKLFGF